MSKVFISYSWDSEEHKRWVRRLSDELNNAGIETVLDSKDLVLGDQLTQFMEQSIRTSDYVLVILTPNYKEKSDNRLGGVGYEGHIITAEVNRKYNHRKFIPVLANGTWDTSTPIWADGKLGVDFSTEESYKQDFPLLIKTLKGKASRPFTPLRKGGRVLTAGCPSGYSDNYLSVVKNWTDITHIAATEEHIVGVKSDGTVIATGRAYEGQCDVEEWTDIVNVAVGMYYTIGIKNNGNVVAVGRCSRRDYLHWKCITTISAGLWHTVGLKSNGRVLAENEGTFPAAINVGNWTDIITLSAGSDHTVGIKKDGKAIACGDNSYGQCDVQNWHIY